MKNLNAYIVSTIKYVMQQMRGLSSCRSFSHLPYWDSLLVFHPCCNVHSLSNRTRTSVTQNRAPNITYMSPNT